MNDKLVILSVSQLNFYLKSLFDSDNNLSDIFISGEISNLKRQFSSGHIYFTLKDDKSAVPAVIFKWYTNNIPFDLNEGMRVICHCKVSLYDKDTKVQLYVTHVQPFGIGSLYLAFEQLKHKLEKKGFFDETNKKSLPDFPKKVGVITSKSGAVFHDFCNVAARRYPLAEIYLCPVSVQGDEVEHQIANMLKSCDDSGIFDVLVLARGGGSFEDLKPFNTEILAQTIFNCNTVVVSAVGHETDYSISDFVADLRAATPSAAAELIFKDKNELSSIFNQYSITLKALVSKHLNQKKLIFDIYKNSKILNDPHCFIDNRVQYAEELKSKLYNSFERIILSKTNRFAPIMSRLNDLNPISILSRGYTITSVNGKTVSSVKSLNNNEELDVKFHDGTAKCRVIELE